MTEKIKYNLFSIFSSTLVAFAIWIYILYNLDPFSVDILAILSFFIWNINYDYDICPN